MTQQLKNVREQLREKAGQLRQMTQELTNVHDQPTRERWTIEGKDRTVVIFMYYYHIFYRYSYCKASLVS